MSERGAAELDRILDNCESFYTSMVELGYSIPYDAQLHIGRGASPPARYNRDMTRLVLSTRPLGLSGAEAERLLWSRYKIKIEMSDPWRIIMITTVADSDEDFIKLIAALTEIAHEQNQRNNKMRDAPQAVVTATTTTTAIDNLHGAPRATADDTRVAPTATAIDNSQGDLRVTVDLTNVIQPDFITELHAVKSYIPLELAENRIAADIIAPYPPGTPLICPGERITASAINEIRFFHQEGVNIKGIRKNDMTIAVFL